MPYEYKRKLPALAQNMKMLEEPLVDPCNTAAACTFLSVGSVYWSDCCLEVENRFGYNFYKVEGLGCGICCGSGVGGEGGDVVLRCCTFLKMLSYFLRVFLRCWSTFLRRWSTFLNFLEVLVQNVITFLRCCIIFLRCWSTFLRRWSTFLELS